jgi:hypothetical protein
MSAAGNDIKLWDIHSGMEIAGWRTVKEENPEPPLEDSKGQLESPHGIHTPRELQTDNNGNFDFYIQLIILIILIMLIMELFRRRM